MLSSSSNFYIPNPFIRKHELMAKNFMSFFVAFNKNWQGGKIQRSNMKTVSLVHILKKKEDPFYYFEKYIP